MYNEKLRRKLYYENQQSFFDTNKRGESLTSQILKYIILIHFGFSMNNRYNSIYSLIIYLISNHPTYKAFFKDNRAKGMYGNSKIK